MLNGKKIRKLRKDLGLTQKELAQIVNVTNVSISGYERNERTPDIDTLVAIARALNTTPNYLLDFDVEITVLNEEATDTYNEYVSEDASRTLKELDKHEEAKRKIFNDPKKWFDAFDRKFN